MKISTIPVLLASVLCAFAGDPSWEKCYNGPANAPDHAEALALDSKGNAVVTGFSTGTSGGYDMLTAKFSGKTGRRIWEQRYDGPTSQYDKGIDVAVDQQGNVVVVGQSIGTGNNYDYYTAKYSGVDGTLLWQQRFDGGYSNGDYPIDLVLDAQGNAIVTGWSYDNNNYSYYTVKYAAADGTPVWGARYRGDYYNSYGQAQAVDVDSQGNVVVTGQSYTSYYSGNYDIHTVKYAAADGAVLWTKIYNGSANSTDYGYDVAVDGEDNVVVAGMTYTNRGYNSDWDYYTAKYSGTDGSTIWEQGLNSLNNGRDEGQRVVLNKKGDVCVTGESRNNYDEDYSGYSILTAMYSGSDGALLWNQQHSVTGYSYQYVTGLTMDSKGNPVIAGYYRDYLQQNNAYKLLGLKLNGKNGDLLWKKISPYGQKNHISRAASVAVDDADRVFMTGYTTGSKNSSDYLIMKCGPLADGLISNVSGSKYLGDDIYNQHALKQTSTVFLAPGSTRSFNVVIQNDAPMAATYAFKGSAGSQNVSVFYTDEKGQDITSAVRNGTYRTRKMPPGTNDVCNVRVSVDGDAPRWQIVPIKMHIGDDDTLKIVVWVN